MLFILQVSILSEQRVKFRVVCLGNLEIGLESDTQVGLLTI